MPMNCTAVSAAAGQAALAQPGAQLPARAVYTAVSCRSSSLSTTASHLGSYFNRDGEKRRTPAQQLQTASV